MPTDQQPAGATPAARFRQRRRLLVLIASLLVSAAFVAWLGRQRGLRREINVVEMSAELREIYEQDALRGGADDAGLQTDGYPPPLKRAPLNEKMTRLFYPACGDPLYVYDERLSSRRESNLDVHQQLPEYPGVLFAVRTNSLGMREDSEVLAAKPDLRLLVTGASNVDGVCANAESATNVLEALLRERAPGRGVEALNVGSVGYNFYNFLAVLERYVELAPDVFVIVAYGGNDFFGNVKLHRYFNRRGPPKTGPHSYERMQDVENLFLRKLLGTEIGQAIFLLNNPADVGFIIDVACSATAEIAKLCEQHHVRLVCAYLPPPLRGQPEFMRAYERQAVELLGEPREIFDVSDRVADAWLAFLESRSIAHVDLRPNFRAATERLYWETDNHVNVAGQRMIAEVLFPLIEAP